MVRVLVLANSYPSQQAPSGAPYLTSRLARLTAHPEVSVQALALVPRYGPVMTQVRRRVGALGNEALELADNEAGGYYQAVPCRWRPSEVVAGRLGRVPMGLVARVAAEALATVGVPGGGARAFDVVHAHGMYTLPAGAVAERVAAALDVPFVVSLHGSDVEEVMPRRAAAYQEVLGRAAATIYVSEALRERAVQLGAPRERSHVIGNGVDLQVFQPAHPARPASAGAGLRPGPGEAPRLLFVGNLLPVKGADRLPAILRAVRGRWPGASLDVAGDGPLRDALEGETISGVRCHGRVEPARVAELMRAASVLVVPSRAEGWGCVITEAYATGTPVVGTAVGGIPEALAGFTRPVPVGAREQPGDAASAASAEPEAAIAQAFAERITQVLLDPPDPAALIAHAAGQGWDTVVAAELAVLTAAAAPPGS